MVDGAMCAVGPDEPLITREGTVRRSESGGSLHETRGPRLPGDLGAEAAGK